MTPAWLELSAVAWGAGVATAAGTAGATAVRSEAAELLLGVALAAAGAEAGDGCNAHPARAIVARIEDESRNCILRYAIAGGRESRRNYERWKSGYGTPGFMSTACRERSARHTDDEPAARR
jgi:hypothetical protein